MQANLQMGVERLVAAPQLAAAWGRCGLLCNQASVDAELRPSWALVHQLLGARLVALFGPQHGFAGTVQDNMIETGHGQHTATGLPVYSLYSETREPTPAMLAGLDTLIIDLQIVGCRIYTWKSTIAGCLRAAKREGKRIVILDRPNPVGGEIVEGRVLDDNAHSFVGQFALPMRHGLSAGEAARLFNSSIGAQLEVVELSGWNPRHYWQDLGRLWVLSSPNLPTPDAVVVYPGTVILEGTNLSEGRGTSLPFQLIGAPYLPSGAALIHRIHDLIGPPPGLVLREAVFQPTAQKWQGLECTGLQLHVTDRTKVRSYQLTLALIKAAIDLSRKTSSGAQFDWQRSPYEYEFETLAIKLIIGSHAVEAHLNKAVFDPHASFWREGIAAYIKGVQPYLLYQRELREG